VSDAADAGEQQMLFRYAEDQFLHGHLLSSWIVDYIDLEESLAVGSIAQEDLAHAALLMELAGEDATGRDWFVYERPLAQWWPSRLVAAGERDWPATVLRGLLVASAGLLLSGNLGETGPPRIRQAATTMLAEQELHLTHWATWARLLSGDTRTHDQLVKCGTGVLPLAQDLFGAAPGMPAAPVLARMYESFVARLRPVLDAASLDVSLLGTEPTARIAGSEQPELGRTLGTVRALRVGPDDGVRAVYR
jgi:1,2-phenylacetyl-CoA epoxidase catalytic subunit